MDQKKAWNSIAEDWSKFRDKPREDVLDFLKKQKGKILDLGCGSGRHFIKSKKIKFYGVDFSKEMLQLAEKKIRDNKINAILFKSDIHKIPFEDNFFDSAICIASLHCLETKTNREKAVKELSRVLKLKAKLLISVWNKNSKRFKTSKKEKYIGWLNKSKRYYYFFDKEEIYNLFENQNFKIIEKFPLERNIVFIAKKIK